MTPAKNPNTVFISAIHRHPLRLTRPAQAQRLLQHQKTAVARLKPSAIILQYPIIPANQLIVARLDPASQSTRSVLAAKFSPQDRVVAVAAYRGCTALCDTRAGRAAAAMHRAATAHIVYEQLRQARQARTCPQSLCSMPAAPRAA